MDYKDYYKTLGVARTATQPEIKKAFRKLARQHHPDRNAGDKAAEERFKDINEANEVLSDPAKRKQYNELGANWEAYARAGGAGAAGGGGGQGAAGGGGGQGAAGGAGGDPFGTGGPFAGFGGAGGTGGQGGGVRYEFRTAGGGSGGGAGGGAGGDQFSDFFRMFFGGQDAAAGGAGRAGGRGSAGSVGGRTRTSTAAGTSIEDLLSGMSAGQAAGYADEGPAPRPQRLAPAEAEAEITLEEAFSGTIRLVDIDGRRLEVKLPAGVDTGSRIRLTGKGGGTGATARDLHIITKVQPNAVFTRSGADLTREVRVTLREAVLGAEIPVRTPKGRVLLTIPAGTQHGRMFRLSGQGMPRLKSEGSGDLYVRVAVVLPTSLSDEAKAAAEAFLDLVDQPDPRASS